MYLRPGMQQLRPLPAQLTADALLSLQKSAYAKNPIIALSSLFNNIKQHPIYAPSSEAPEIELELLSDTNESGGILTGVRLNGQEVFSETQSNPELNLRSLLSKDSATAGEIARTTSRVFSVPYVQLKLTDTSDDPLQLISTAGFHKMTFETGEET
jgi:hypothetical protein